MEYVTNGKHYVFSYTEMTGLYWKFVNYTDSEFLQNLPDILHFSCIVSYFKELGVEATVGDEGIVHQLVHLLCIPDEPVIELDKIREQFKNLMRL